MLTKKVTHIGSGNVTLELNVRVWPTVIKTGYLANGMQND